MPQASPNQSQTKRYFYFYFELLSKSGYFGRFGNVEKIVLSKNTPYASKHNRNITYNAYITF